MLNFSELGDQLNITGAGAKKRLVKYEEDLKQYIVYEDSKMVGYEDTPEAIEAIRHIKRPLRRSMVVQREIDRLTAENAEMSLKMRLLQDEIDMKNKMLAYYEKQFTGLSLIVDNLVKIKEKPPLLERWFGKKQ